MWRLQMTFDTSGVNPPTPRPGRAVSHADAARLARPGRGFVGRLRFLLAALELSHNRGTSRLPPTPRPGRAVLLVDVARLARPW